MLYDRGKVDAWLGTVTSDMALPLFGRVVGSVECDWPSVITHMGEFVVAFSPSERVYALHGLRDLCMRRMSQEVDHFTRVMREYEDMEAAR